MGAAQFVRSERLGLCDLLLERGPDAPTLCEGWTTRDLAAHLVIREARPDASLGLVLKPAEWWTERVQSGAAERPYPELVEAIRNGPGRLSFFGLPGVDAAANVFEYFVHHEDVRRIGAWEPRDLDPADCDLLWSRLQGAARALLRSVPCGVVLERTDGSGGRKEVKSGDLRVRLRGPVQELVMMAFGRREANSTEVVGDAAAIEAFAEGSLKS